MMTQTQTNTGDYFTLDNPSLNNKPQPTTATVLQPQQQKKGGLLNRRQAQATYLHQIELPSLPPLSHLLTTDSEAKENNDAAVAAAVAASVQQQNQAMGSLGYPIMPQQQPYFDAVAAAAAASSVVVNPAQTTTDFMPQHHTNTVSSTADFVPVTTQHHDATTMMDPTAAFTMDPMYAAMSMPPTTQPGTMMPLHTQAPTRARQSSHSSESSAEKIYSFVAIPGTNHKKRPRRRYDEIERLYHCNWPDCTKSYGTLNHLNAHVSMQKHGAKRHPSEFKEMRKEWRRLKKEREAHKKRNEEAMKQQHQGMMQNAAYHPQLPHFQYGTMPTTTVNTMSMNGFF